ncbi:50S ribosomal protein L11 methyltransferase [Maribacter confluentis]|uniref:Ribosomal protein L11 methyltransferase n=1 Tax=Maribacter confluentis TaxID=1656093 RepID=A0ABT8RUR0_9FLAO|nr:50S ribosomal protein L11 methyltransferase [Maribacter confluentis]MDO1513811.1 50S ribosomal protein L11 methyltransferase [Maribacter confluentis]
MSNNMIYIEYRFTVQPPEPASDILIAQLGEAGFESFVEEEDAILAYIQKEDWSMDILNDIDILSNPNFEIDYAFKEIEQENWNATWEQNFQPIVVDDRCMIRAPFHETMSGVEYDIVIEPKMSFGTGHHETTHMMLQHILQLNLEGKVVLDMGSGTGVLAILAALRGAAHVDAVDIDNWCYVNAKENVARNQIDNVQVYEGDVSLVSGKSYDLIIANINRNILLADIPAYSKALNKDGILLLSGFYTEDLDMITEKCKINSLKFVKNIERNNWVAAKYVN